MKKKKDFKKSLLTYASDIHFKMRSFPLYSSRGSVKKRRNCASVFHIDSTYVFPSIEIFSTSHLTFGKNVKISYKTG